MILQWKSAVNCQIRSVAGTAVPMLGIKVAPYLRRDSKDRCVQAAICFAGAFWRFLRPTISNFEFWQLNDNRDLARFLATATQRTVLSLLVTA